MNKKLVEGETAAQRYKKKVSNMRFNVIFGLQNSYIVDAMRKAAEKENISVAQWIKNAIREKLSKDGYL